MSDEQPQGYPQYPPNPPYQPYQAYQAYPPQPYYYYPPAPKPPLSPSDERLWGMLSYLLALFGGLIAPLLIWVIYKDRSAFVRDVAKESLNFHITALIVYLAGFFTLFIVAFGAMAVNPAGGAVVFVALWALVFCWMILIIVIGIVGATRANAGVYWRIPGILRFVK